MGIAKKVRKKRKTAPLSVLDKCIYVGLTILIFAIFFFTLIILGHEIPEKIAYQKEAVIAATLPDSWLKVWVLVLPTLTLWIPLLIGLENKQPLFGNKRFKPTGKYPAVTLTPLFTKKFFIKLTRKDKKLIKTYCIVLAVVLVVCIVVQLFGIYPSKTLDENGRFVTYNSFNKITHEQKTVNVKCFTVYVEKVHHGRSYLNYHHRVAMDFSFTDSTYSFTLLDFANLSTEEAVKYLLDVKKDLGSGRFRVENAEDIEKVFEYYDYSENEKDLIRQLFDCDD